MFPEVLNWEMSADPRVGAVVPKSVSVTGVWARAETAQAMTIIVTANAPMTGEVFLGHIGCCSNETGVKTFRQQNAIFAAGTHA